MLPRRLLLSLLVSILWSLHFPVLFASLFFSLSPTCLSRSAPYVPASPSLIAKQIDLVRSRLPAPRSLIDLGCGDGSVVTVSPSLPLSALYALSFLPVFFFFLSL